MRPLSDEVLATPRRVIIAGFAVAIAGIFAESTGTRPSRFPDWYPVWFWVPATAIILATCAWALLDPGAHRTRIVAAASAVWCFARALMNLSRITEPGSVWPAIVGFTLLAGFGIVMYGVGLAASTTTAISEKHP